MEGTEANLENDEKSKDDGIKFSEMDKMLKDCNRYMNECEEVLQDCAKYFENVDETESIFSDEDDSIHEVVKDQSLNSADDSSFEKKKESCVHEEQTFDGNCDDEKSTNENQNIDSSSNSGNVIMNAVSTESTNNTKKQSIDAISENVGDFVAKDHTGESSIIPESKSEKIEGNHTNLEDQKDDSSCSQTDNDNYSSKDNTSENISIGDALSLSSVEKTENKSELNPSGSSREESEMKEHKNYIENIDYSRVDNATDSDLSTEAQSVESQENYKDSVQFINNETSPDILNKQADSNTNEGYTEGVFEPTGTKSDDENVDEPKDNVNESTANLLNNHENIVDCNIEINQNSKVVAALDEDYVFTDENSKNNDAVKIRLDHLESEDSLDDDYQDVKLVPLRISEEFDSEIEKMKMNIEEYVDTKLSENLFCASENDHKKKECVDNKVEQSSSDEKQKETNSEAPKVVDIETENSIKYKMEATQTVQEGWELKTQADREEQNEHIVSLQSKMEELEKELSSMKAALKSAHNQLANQQSTMNSTVMTLKLELYRTQTALKRERTKSHQQLTDVISHLMFLEGNLRKGQIKHKKELKVKDETIEIQKTEIVKLRDQNEQLLNAIKEICANGGMNGYMRDKHSHSEKKGNNGKLGMVKDKLLMKNRSSLELNNFSMEKFNLKNQRLCSSQEDLKNLHDDAFEDNSPGHGKGSVFGKSRGTLTRGSKKGNKGHRKNLQNFFTEPEIPKHEMNKSNSDSSQLSESSGVHSMSDHDCPQHITSGINGHSNHFDDDDFEDDEDDGRIFSFSSTHINTVIDEEEALGPVVSHSGHMMSMGSMPMLAPVKERQNSNKDRPHSLSSVDLLSIQRQAANLSKSMPNDPIAETSTTPTPPPSPSYNNNNNNNNSKSDSGKSEMTPFQTFKTMFKRKGSKNKGNKKRSVSLSQTTNMEYTEALKKHFQKFDMQ